MEEVFSFESFIQDGIDYLQSQYVSGRKTEMHGEDTGKVIERMKGVLTDVKRYTHLLRSGYGETPDEIYSTYENSDSNTANNAAAGDVTNS